MGYNRLTMEEYSELLLSTPEDKRSEVNGPSPGGAAGRLGISRQAVHDAINRDTLHGFYITRNGRMVAIIIPDAEIARYRREHLRKVS